MVWCSRFATASNVDSGLLCCGLGLGKSVENEVLSSTCAALVCTKSYGCSGCQTARLGLTR